MGYHCTLALLDKDCKFRFTVQAINSNCSASVLYDMVFFLEGCSEEEHLISLEKTLVQ